MLDILLRKERGVAKLNMSGTLSKDLLDQTPLRVVSQLPHLHGCFVANPTVDEAGPQVRIKTRVYQEVLKDATPSEEAVCLFLTPFAELDAMLTRYFPGKIGPGRGVNPARQNVGTITLVCTHFVYF